MKLEFQFLVQVKFAFIHTHRYIHKYRWSPLLKPAGKGRDFIFQYTLACIYTVIQYVYLLTQQGQQQQNQSQTTNYHDYFISDISIPDIQ